MKIHQKGLPAEQITQKGKISQLEDMAIETNRERKETEKSGEHQ